ncbi:MAG: prepilin-type N-terminal cleavage/methylation domain-containing protein [Fibrobacter sp.]|nr:prepilin-type N-terminal cleavage/methylation domain-containing protein [Fibrobacter sp.]
MLSNKQGFTFLELIVAISIAAIVVLLAYRFIRDTQIGVSLQNRRSSAVDAMILTRAAITKSINSIAHLKSVQSNRIEFVTSESDSLHTIELKADSLVYDSRKLCSNIKSILFDQSNSSDLKQALYWECVMINGKVIYGARVIRDLSP